MLHETDVQIVCDLLWRNPLKRYLISGYVEGSYWRTEREPSGVEENFHERPTDEGSNKERMTYEGETKCEDSNTGENDYESK